MALPISSCFLISKDDITASSSGNINLSSSSVSNEKSSPTYFIEWEYTLDSVPTVDFPILSPYSADLSLRKNVNSLKIYIASNSNVDSLNSMRSEGYLNLGPFFSMDSMRTLASTKIRYSTKTKLKAYLDSSSEKPMIPDTIELNTWPIKAQCPIGIQNQICIQFENLGAIPVQTLKRQHTLGNFPENFWQGQVQLKGKTKYLKIHESYLFFPNSSTPNGW